jgi:hypothetical protein
MNSIVNDITEDQLVTYTIPINASCNEAIEAGICTIQGKYDFDLQSFVAILLINTNFMDNFVNFVYRLCICISCS